MLGISPVLLSSCLAVLLYNKKYFQKVICHLDIHVELFYHSVDAACVGYVSCIGAKRHFEYCPTDGNSLAGIPKVFLDRFNIGEMMAGQFYL